MSKFGSKYGSNPRVAISPLQSTSTVKTNHGGAAAYGRTPKSDLFLLGVANFVGEQTFYESAAVRDKRFVDLVHAVTKEDPEWVEQFVPWLRNVANMRSASVVAAVEYAIASSGMPPVYDERTTPPTLIWRAKPSSVIDSACSRADEPGEVLAYWIGVHGNGSKIGMPSSVKRGAAKAAARLYNQKSLLKYDGNSKAMRFGDVIQITHAKPADDYQSELFKVALDSRYGNDAALDRMTTIRAAAAINSGEVTRDQLLANPDLYRSAGMTWEQLSGLGPMDAAAWELAIPTMGYMALLRNLRNFEQAGVSTAATQAVIARLSDAEQVAKSRQLPYRFLSAYKNVQGLQWGYPLELALGHSLKNLPALPGRTLLLVDTSASMSGVTFSEKSTMTAAEAAAVFGASLALKGENVDWLGFASGQFKHEVSKGASVLKTVEAFMRRTGEVGHGTDIPGALRHWNGHDRVILMSDMQTLAGPGIDRYRGYNRYQVSEPADARVCGVPENIPVFGFNLGGYGSTQIGTRNEFELGGLTDQTFGLIPLLERAGTARWPWEG